MVELVDGGSSMCPRPWLTLYVWHSFHHSGLHALPQAIVLQGKHTALHQVADLLVGEQLLVVKDGAHLQDTGTHMRTSRVAEKNLRVNNAWASGHDRRPPPSPAPDFSPPPPPIPAPPPVAKHTQPPLAP